jgi:hypothetical protein
MQFPMKTALGDFKAKVGKESYLQVYLARGGHSLHNETSDNGNES